MLLLQVLNNIRNSLASFGQHLTRCVARIARHPALVSGAP
jgi:hypothetical protein